ncbi:MAG: aminopeptidase P N-terminal domain-containing protein [Vicinamibacteria bacterium]|jgi:Xaa-Pro aminopeptidase|nr:aminopeptidase P N-terminal domain-containing protein [Vicinamibacteria bacterium]
MDRGTTMSRMALVATLLLCASSPSLFAGEYQDDLKARRARVMESLDAGTVMIAWSAPARVYSTDVNYEYRQDSNLLYLTGITQEDTILVLMPGAATKKEVIFVREPNPRAEHRNGHILTKEEVTAQSGIETVYFVAQFEPFITAMFNGRTFGVRRGETSTEWNAFHAEVNAGRSKLALLFGPRPAPSQPLSDVYTWANRFRERFFGVSLTDAQPIVHALRQVKTAYEQKVLETSVLISSNAHKAGMKVTAPGKFEYEVEAAIEQVYLANGAMSWGYPSIVGSGPNSTILHYGESSRKMENGDLLLVDAAGSYQGLTGDITRTTPVNGKFSPAQKEIYSLVLAAQEAGMAAAKIGNKTADVERAVEEVIKAGLLKLGLITDASGEEFRTWYTHGICHWIGMDVHDVGDYDRPLAAGMAFVVEPGLYIRPQALDQLPNTPQSAAFRAKVGPAVEKYKNIGVRIEDSFVLTATGLKSLSSTVPKTIEEVEAWMKPASPRR